MEEKIDGTIDETYKGGSVIGSPDELAEYGVWVKSGPQDFEEPFGDESADISLDLSRDFSPFGDDEFPDFGGSGGIDSIDAIDAGEAAAGNNGGFDFSDSVFENTEDESLEGQDTIDIDIPPDTETPAAYTDDEVMDLDFFPETGTDALDSPESGDFSVPEGFAEWGDFSLSEDSEKSANSGTDTGETGLEEISLVEEVPEFEILDAGLPEENTAETGTEASKETEVSKDPIDDFEIDFEDISGLPEIPLEDLPEAGETPDAPPGDNAGADNAVPASDGEVKETGVSTQLLLQIVNELSSIKSEIADLKKELAASKDTTPPKEPAGQSEGRVLDETGDENTAPAPIGEAESGGDEGALIGVPGEEPEVPDETVEAVPEAAGFAAPLEDEPVEDISTADFPSPETAGEIPVGETGEEIEEVEELAGPISEPGEPADDLVLELPVENDGEAAAFDPSIDDSFAQIIPEGFEEKPSAPPLHTEAAPDEDDFFDTGILADDETPETEPSGADTQADIPDGGDTGGDVDFDLGPEPNEAAPDSDSEIPDFSLDLGAEFDSADLEPEEDIAINIPADSEDENNENDESAGFDFADEILESLDITLPEDSTEIPGESFGGDDLSTDPSADISNAPSNDLPEDSGEVLPDLVPKDEPETEIEAQTADEFPVEDEYLSPEFDEFSITSAEEIPEAEVSPEPIPEPPDMEPEPVSPEPVPEPPAPTPAPPEPVTKAAPAVKAADVPPNSALAGVPEKVRTELRTVLSYMDKLLESLPEEKIEEFARSEYFDTYKKLFEDLGLG
jgi:hypothetical protein